MKFNEDLPVSSFLHFSFRSSSPSQWQDIQVIVPLVLSFVFLILFLVIECLVAPEPVLPPCLLRKKVPVLVGLSNYFVSLCNFSVMYFVPLWFQTVPLDSASIAGMFHHYHRISDH